MLCEVLNYANVLFSFYQVMGLIDRHYLGSNDILLLFI